MRILFYTAFAFFLALTGVLAFYALQSPISAGSAKVVLSIDTTGMPRDVAEQSGTNDIFEDELKAGGSKAALQSGENVVGTGAANVEPANTETVPAQTASAETPFAGTSPNDTSAASSNDALDAPQLAPAHEPEKVEPHQPQAIRESVMAPIPDANAADTLPVEQAPQVVPKQPQGRPQAVASLDQEPAPATPEKDASDLGGVKTENGVTNVATVEDGHAPPVLAPSSALSAKSLVVAEPAAPAVVSPPLPMRRPSTPPPARVATADGWGTLTTAVTGAPGGVRVAILLRGIGQDRRDSQDAIVKLPGAISFGVLTTDDGEELAARAREKGHEIVVQLPKDLDFSAAPSAFDFLSSSAPKDGETRVQSLLSRFKGYTGVTTPAGSKVLQSKDALRPIMQDIKARNIVFIAEGTNSHALAREMAAELKIRYGNAAVIIDTQPTPDGIKAALDRLVGVAQKRGSAIGIGYVSSETIDQIQAWSQGLAAQGITLVPAVSLASTL